MDRYARLLPAFVVILSLGAVPAVAQKKYDPGASDTEIKIGNTNPYSGPASACGTIGRTIAAYFNKVNAQGGVNGRKITFITYDDEYSSPKTVEQVRKLVESDEVLLILQSLGTAPNSAIERYMAKTPQQVIRKIRADMVAALAAPTVRDKLEQGGALIIGSTPDELASFLSIEMAKWGPIKKRIST
jgi:hypothetical protein